MSVFSPLVIVPNFLENLTKMKYDRFGGNIHKEEVDSILSYINNQHDIEHVVCFIGGFFDTYYKVLWNAFATGIKYKQACMYCNVSSDIAIPIESKNICAFYISFNCFNFLYDFIPKLSEKGYKVSVIAHSWGAKNILRLCLKHNLNICNLVTIDCVGHFTITHRPTNILQWENIYIIDHFSSYSRANLAAIIGGAKQYIPYADSNIAINPPANHASVSAMLCHSNLINYKNIKF